MRTGRPRKEINSQQLYELAVIRCTELEMAAVLGISIETFERRRAERKQWPVVLTKDAEPVYLSFREILSSGRAIGRVSMRRKQWELAMAGDRTMLIWLGKQFLGQRDMVGISDPDGGAVQIRPVYDEILGRIAGIAARIGAAGANHQIATGGSGGAALQLEVLGASEATPTNGSVAPVVGPHGPGLGKDKDGR
mgnify:CR=1 FL=1